MAVTNAPFIKCMEVEQILDPANLSFHKVGVFSYRVLLHMVENNQDLALRLEPHIDTMLSHVRDIDHDFC